ncbi:MAG: hypothetical protein ACRDRK_00885 [Pseudonocardia sp.]
MSSGDPTDPTDLADELTIWASPGVIADPARPDLGSIAVLMLVPSITAHTSDDHPGAEQIDVIISDLLRSGFGLVSRLEPAELAELPTLGEWSALLGHNGQYLQITEPGGTLYDGDLGGAPPEGWHAALHRRRRLVALVGSAVDIGAVNRGDRIDQAAGTGGVVGAQLPLRVTYLDVPG